MAARESGDEWKSQERARIDERRFRRLRVGHTFVGGVCVCISWRRRNLLVVRLRRWWQRGVEGTVHRRRGRRDTADSPKVSAKKKKGPPFIVVVVVKHARLLFPSASSRVRCRLTSLSTACLRAPAPSGCCYPYINERRFVCGPVKSKTTRDVTFFPRIAACGQLSDKVASLRLMTNSPSLAGIGFCDLDACP